MLRVNPDGSRVYLRDVARVELGGQDYSIKARIDGKPASAAAIKLSPTANALDTAAAVRAEVDRLPRNSSRPGVKVDYPAGHLALREISVDEVLKTLVEAIILVFLVMYLFLQNFRATLIPTLVVPVALLGTCGILAAFGFSINVLTMFGMVLAIGILVDDAIVVVENVERIMSEEGLPAKEATRKAMGQITSALIGITRGAHRGVHPDGVLRRLGGHDLPAVHHVDGVVHAVLGVPRAFPDAGALRLAVETSGCRPPPRQGRVLSAGSTAPSTPSPTAIKAGSACW